MTNIQPDFVHDSNGGVQRRTLVAGAAWTIPVVATAIGAPLAAASGETPTLAFINGPYTVAACGTLKDVVIKATTDGTTAAPFGTPVTVTLPAGLTWSDGGTGSRPFSTDANGEVVLSGVKAIATVGSQTITATTPVASASAPVSISASGGAFIVSSTGGTLAAPTGRPAVPAGSTAVGQQTYLAPNGDLYYTNTLVATGVTSASAENVGAGSDYITYVSNGAAYIVASSGGVLAAPTARPGVPAGSTVVGQQTYLTPDGDLYYTDTLVATGVTSASAQNVAGGTDYITYVANETAYIVATSGGTVGAPTARPSVPAGSVAVGQQTYLAANGDLYYGDALAATGVTSAHAETVGAGFDYITYVANGTAYIASSSGGVLGAPTARPAVPAGSTAVGQQTYLAPNGDLYYTNTLAATGVSSATAQNVGAETDYITYTTAGNC